MNAIDSVCFVCHHVYLMAKAAMLFELGSAARLQVQDVYTSTLDCCLLTVLISGALMQDLNASLQSAVCLQLLADTMLVCCCQIPKWLQHLPTSGDYPLLTAYLCHL